MSYIKDVHIETATSDFHDDLQVLLVKGEYQLVTPEAIYSYGHRYDNYFTAFKELKIREYDIEEVLILGTGLASIPYMLENYFDRSYNYTAVEIDETVIELASKYVINGMKSSVTTICTDASTYVHIDKNKYDLIAMDVFVSDFIPEEFESEEYLRTLESMLSDNGILMYNRLYYFDKDKKNTEKFYYKVFKKVFPNARYLNVMGNWIIVNK